MGWPWVLAYPMAATIAEPSAIGSLGAGSRTSEWAIGVSYERNHSEAGDSIYFRYCLVVVGTPMSD